MSWLKLNDSLNKVKGQITTFAQEVLAEGIIEEEANPVQELEDANLKIDELTSLCTTQDNEITILRRKIIEYQHQLKTPDPLPSSSKSLPDNNAALEDSWFWDPENNASSTSSSSKKDDNDSPSGTDLTTIPLEAPSSDNEIIDKLHRQINVKEQKYKKLVLENAILNEKLAQVNSENKELNENIEELDKQHDMAIEKLLSVKTDLVEKCSKLQDEINETDKKKNVENKTELNDLKIQYSNMEKNNVELKAEIEILNKELKKIMSENTDSISAFELKINELQKMKEVCDNELAVKSVAFEQLSEKTRNAEQEFRDADVKLQHEHNNLKEKYEELLKLMGEKEKMQHDFETLQREYDDLKSKYEDDFVALQNEEKFDELKAKDVELRKELENISIEKQKALEDFVALQEDNNDLQKQFDEVKAKYETLANKDSKEAKSDEISQLEQEINELKNELRSVIIDNSIQLDAKEKEFSIKYDGLYAEKRKLEDDLSKLSSDQHAIPFIKVKELFKKYLDYDLKTNQISNLEEALATSKDLAARVGALERKLIDSSKDINFVKSENSKIQHEKDTLKADLVQYEIECSNLMKNNDLLITELDNLKCNKLETINENAEDSIVILEKQLEDCSNMNQSLEDEYHEVQKKLDECQTQKSDLESRYKALEEKLNEKVDKCKELVRVVDNLENEKSNLLFEINEVKSDDTENTLRTEIEASNSYVDDLKAQLTAINEDHAQLVGKLQQLQQQSVENIKKAEATIEEQKQTIGVKESHIKQLYVDLLKAKDEIEALKLKKSNTDENVVLKFEVLQQNLNEEKEKVVLMQQEKQEMIVSLENVDEKLVQSSEEINRLNQIIEELNKSYNGSNEKLTEINKTIELLTLEKQNLIALITAKHNENVQYHNEIQRLNQLLHNEIEKSQSIVCTDCPALKEKLEKLEGEVKKLEDFEKMVDQIQFLREKSDILTNNLMIEQNNQKVANQEKLELAEQKNDLSKDLGRLRQHLLDIEEMHTQETVELQQRLDETKGKLLGLEQETKKSSNAYTSASIRANQHAETIQAQYMLLQQQRDELSAKLSVAEDRESKNLASLTNLQCALEQFQTNKDRDIELATNAIRKELNDVQWRENSLRTEILQLQQQLSDAKNGLLAAARISDQLEISQVTIATLKTELIKFNDKYSTLEKKLNDNEVNQADKVEKSLVKNLLIGYIVAPNQNDKTQILKLISAVLSLDPMECNKIGLNKTQGGWLNNILLGGGGGGSGNSDANYNKESLTESFVKFLEKESQPRNTARGPTLLNLVHPNASSHQHQTTDTSRPMTQTPIDVNQNPVAVQPILLSENMLQQTFAPQRNSSAILKDILSDS